MKLRIRETSLRLRLDKKDIEHFAKENFIEEELFFSTSSGNSFRYALKTNNLIEKIIASFEDGQILVQIPKTLAENWIAGSDVGLAEQGNMKILIEKDFACLTQRDGEDDSNAFPNPEATSHAK